MNIENNVIDVIHKYGLDLSNIKTLNVQGNQFGIPTKMPSIIIEYDESVRYMVPLKMYHKFYHFL